jgi:hypothetical protein
MNVETHCNASLRPYRFTCGGRKKTERSETVPYIVDPAASCLTNLLVATLSQDLFISNFLSLRLCGSARNAISEIMIIFIRIEIVRYFIIVLVFSSTLFAQNKKWGWTAHEYINDQALDHLPAEMSFFQDHRTYLVSHSTDPDRDKLPGYYHYIDIDYYPEFFDGTLPHDLDSLTALYDETTMQNNGIIPWIIEEWTDSLTVLMAAGQWDNVWQVAAELGHYVADSHQPLHLTLNYNGQLSDNYGIHSRYETQMTNQFLPDISKAQGSGLYWPNVIDSVFIYIDEIYSYVDSVLIADDLASDQDPSYTNVYYNIMWQELEQVTTISLHKAILDLASIWRTAWENAGSPTPADIQSNDRIPESYYLADAYPNPFNPVTAIDYQLSAVSDVELSIYNNLGQKIVILVSERQPPGLYSIRWDAGDLASGVYYYSLQTREFKDVKKVILLR